MALALGRCADASRDGLLLSGGYDGTVRAWVCPADDLRRRRRLGAVPHLEGHTDAHSRWRSRGRAASAFGLERRHRAALVLADGTCAAVLGHADGVSAMGWQLASGCLATGSEDAA